MKKLIIILVMLFGITYSAQISHLGATQEVIINAMKEKDCQIEIDTLDSVVRVSTTAIEFGFAWIFVDDVCVSHLVFPMRTNALNAWVTILNEDCITISDTNWKLYTNNGIAYIELTFSNNSAYFIYTKNEVK